MKWFTHKAVAVAGALAAGAHAGALVAVLVGSVLPDMVDTAIAHGDKKVWRRIHRQTSHWFGWYVLLILLGFTLPLQEVTADLLRATNISFPGVSRSALSGAGELGNDLIVWVGIGGLVHVLLDALTPMRVPVYPFGGSKRFGISLVSTGTWNTPFSSSHWGPLPCSSKRRGVFSPPYCASCSETLTGGGSR